MPTIPLPHKITQLKYEIETLKESIQYLETPVTAPKAAAKGSLLETLTASLTAIGDAEEQERSRLVKLGKMRDLLTDADQTLQELQKQQLRSKPLFDAGMIRLEKNRKEFNKAIDKILSTWDEFQQALKSIEDDALVQVGTAPSTRTQYPLDSDWLTKVGKVGPMNAQNYFPVVRFDRLTDGE